MSLGWGWKLLAALMPPDEAPRGAELWALLTHRLQNRLDVRHCDLFMCSPARCGSSQVMRAACPCPHFERIGDVACQATLDRDKRCCPHIKAPQDVVRNGRACGLCWSGDSCQTGVTPWQAARDTEKLPQTRCQCCWRWPVASSVDAMLSRLDPCISHSVAVGCSRSTR